LLISPDTGRTSISESGFIAFFSPVTPLPRRLLLLLLLLLIVMEVHLPPGRITDVTSESTGAALILFPVTLRRQFQAR